MATLTEGRIDYAAQRASEAGLSSAQVSAMQAYLLGVVLTHFDESPPLPLTDARWRRIVNAAIAECRD